MQKYNKFFTEMEVPIEIGDEILTGKFKNKRAIVQGFGTDDKGQPTLITNKGTINLYKVRIPSLMEHYVKFFERRDYEAERKEKKKKQLAKRKVLQDRIDSAKKDYMKKYNVDEKTMKSFVTRMKKGGLPNKIVAEHLFKGHKPTVTFDMLDFIQDFEHFQQEYGVTKKEVLAYNRMTNALYKIEELINRLEKVK